MGELGKKKELKAGSLVAATAGSQCQSQLADPYCDSAIASQLSMSHVIKLCATLAAVAAGLKAFNSISPIP